MMPEDLFRSGWTEMPPVPFPEPAMQAAWNSVLVNKVFAAVAVLLVLLNLKDFFVLLEPIFYSFSHSRGNVALEHSVSQSRLRNVTAGVLALPFCLLADRFGLYRPDFIAALPAGWRVAALLGILLAFLLVRFILFKLLCPSRLRGDERITLLRTLYTYFIALTVLMLVSTGILFVLHAGDAVVRTVLLWETAAAYLFYMVRTTQFLAWSCSGFATFLYLCSLELILAAMLVASALLL